MTRQAFVDDIQYWDELIEFCNEEGIEYYVEDIITDLDEYVEDDIREALHNMYWYDILPRLEEISRDYGAYRRDGLLDYVGLDSNSDFNEVKEAVLDNYDADELWDPEVQEITQALEVFQEDDTDFGEEPFELDVDVEAGTEEFIEVNSEIATAIEYRLQEAKRMRDARNREYMMASQRISEQIRAREESESAVFVDMLSNYLL